MTESRAGTNPATDIALVAVFAGLIAAFTLLPAVPVGGLGVPITLQTLAVALTGMILGPWRGFLATSLYLVVGFAGLPVFAQGGAGLATLTRPSAGYLLAFPLGALVTGWLAHRLLARNPRQTWLWLCVAGLVGTMLVIHPIGIIGLSINAQIPLSRALIADLAFWPGDILKVVVAGAVAASVHRAFPQLLGRSG